MRSQASRFAPVGEYGAASESKSMLAATRIHASGRDDCQKSADVVGYP